MNELLLSKANIIKNAHIKTIDDINKSLNRLIIFLLRGDKISSSLPFRVVNLYTRDIVTISNVNATILKISIIHKIPKTGIGSNLPSKLLAQNILAKIFITYNNPNPINSRFFLYIQ
jgi:hypothetical protein